MNTKNCFFTLLFFSFSLSIISAQTFRAGILVGVNASQIDGDRMAGYNKLGLIGGLRGVAILSDNTELCVEMLFSQEGSQSELVKGNNFVPFKIKLNYAEVPIYYKYKDWLDEEGGYYKIHVYGGLSYGRLINSEVEDDLPNSTLLGIENFFNKNDISILVGASYFTSEHLGFSFRWNRSLNLLYKNNDSNPNQESMVGKHLSFYIVYLFLIMPNYEIISAHIFSFIIYADHLRMW